MIRSTVSPRPIGIACAAAACICASARAEPPPRGGDAGRFAEIFCAVEKDHGSHFPYDRPCGEALHLAGSPAPSSGKTVYLGPARTRLRILIVPGILGECVAGLAKPFQDAVGPMERQGWKVDVLHVAGRSGSAANAREISDQLRALRLEPGEDLALVGYSKGMSDILELLGSPDQAVIPSGTSIVSLTGVVRGTPIADTASGPYKAFSRISLPHCPPGDGKGVESLTRAHRLAWLSSHRLPARLHYYSLPAYTAKANVSIALRSGWSTLARSDPRNDGQVIATDAVIPGSTVLGYANSDHWALVLPFALKAPVRSRLFATHNDYPRVVLLESIARFLEEQYLDEHGRRPGG